MSGATSAILVKNIMSKSVDSKENEEEAQEVVNAADLSPQQQLYYYSRRGDIEGIKNAAKSPQVDMNAVDNEKLKADTYVSRNTALHYAVMSGKLECVKVLYNLEAKLDATNKLKSTPLHLAASLGYTEIVKYLIEVKANFEAKNIVQNTPLHCAVYAGHVDTVQAILSNIDEPRQSLLEPNGVGMGAAKYTAHEDMKSLLRTYFPKKNKNNNMDEENKDNDNDNTNDNYGNTDGNNNNSNNGGSNDVQEEQEEQPPPYNDDDDNAPPQTSDNNNDNEQVYNPTDTNKETENEKDYED